MKHTQIRKYFVCVLFIQLLAGAVTSACGAAIGYKKLDDGAELSVDGGTLRIYFWSPEIVRVTYAPGVNLPELKSLSVVATPQSVRLTQQESGESYSLASQKITSGFGL